MKAALIEKRISQLEDNIRKDLELLKAYEDQERLIRDPRDLAKSHEEIKRQKEMLTIRWREYDELQAQLTPDQKEHLNGLLRSNEVELQKADIMLMAANLAHQMLLPIQALIANVETFENEIISLNPLYRTSELSIIAADIRKEAIMLSYSAESLMDWMKEERDFRYTFKNTNMHNILRDIVNLFRNDAYKRGIILNYPQPIEGPFPEIIASEYHIKRVFFNLIQNAVNYSFDNHLKKNYIDIICQRVGRSYSIGITNYGVGILQNEIYRKIYEKGYRGVLARDRNRMGSGLGLWSARIIVEGHNGKIKAESKPISAHDPGKLNLYKTTFTVYLPISEKMDNNDEKN